MDSMLTRNLGAGILGMKLWRMERLVGNVLPMPHVHLSVPISFLEENIKLGQIEQ